MAAPDDRPVERLRRHFAELSQDVAATDFLIGCLLGGFGTETTGQSEPTRQRLLQRFADWTKALAQVVSEAADRHRLLAALTPKDAATFLLNSREGAVLRARVDRDGAPVDTFEKVAFASLFKGEKRSPTRTSARKGQNDNKQIVLQVLKGAFIDRDPGIVAKYFMPDYKQHNPTVTPNHRVNTMSVIRGSIQCRRRDNHGWEVRLTGTWGSF
jgi:hypothetical protein